MTNRLFHARPSWLTASKERLVVPAPQQSLQFTPKTTARTADKSLTFLLECFRTLYGMGLSNKQVAEVTALMCLYTTEGKHQPPFFNLARLPITETDVARWQGAEPPSWYRSSGKFFWAFDSLEDFFKTWLSVRLNGLDPIGFKFWHGDDWIQFFATDPEVLRTITDRIKILFAQHVLKISPVSGTWTPTSRSVCKAFQELHPKSIMPWKQGELDGFTYKALARRWRAQGMF